MARSNQKLSPHDLYHLHCAIFASDDVQLKLVAESIADTPGDRAKNRWIVGYGEQYGTAWPEMMKYWILGDHKKAVQQSELIWGAYRESWIMPATKPLVTP